MNRNAFFRETTVNLNGNSPGNNSNFPQGSSPHQLGLGSAACDRTPKLKERKQMWVKKIKIKIKVQGSFLSFAEGSFMKLSVRGSCQLDAQLGSTGGIHQDGCWSSSPHVYLLVARKAEGSRKGMYFPYKDQSWKFPRTLQLTSHWPEDLVMWTHQWV